MNTFHHNPDEQKLGALFKAATHVELSDAERAETRTVLSEYMKFRPLRATHYSTFSRFSQFFSRELRIHPIPVIAAVLVLTITGSTAAAAEHALPGDFLYDIKVSVNEPVRSALATSAEAKATWEIERAERRMEEAAVLALSGELDEETSIELNHRFEAHVAKAEAEKEALQENDGTAAARIETNLNAALLAHVDVLSAVREEVEDDGNRTRIDTVIERVSTRTLAIADAAAANETMTTMSLKVTDSAFTEEQDGDKESVEKERSVAKARIAASERLIERNEKRIKEETRTKLKVRLSDAKSIYAKAEQALARGNTREARTSFNKAITDAIHTKALLAVQINRGESKKGFLGENRATSSVKIEENMQNAITIQVPASGSENATISITASPTLTISTTSTTTISSGTDEGSKTEIEIDLGDESTNSGKGSIHIEVD